MSIGITVKNRIHRPLFGLGIDEYAVRATISGHVYAKDGATGIANVQVSAFSADGSGCADWHNGISTDSNGYYVFTVDP